MEGDLRSIALSDALELLHGGKRSGRLAVRSRDVLLHLYFHGGEITGGGILDWTGFEAITSFDLQAREGELKFKAEAVIDEPEPLMPFPKLLTEWARLTDEWHRYLGEIGPPSRVYRASGDEEGELGIFREPLSVRGAARRWGVPLIEAMERVARGVREGRLSFTGQYRWFPMRIRHHLAPEPPEDYPHREVVRHLVGEKTLGELITEGLPIEEVRAFLIYELSHRKMQPRGRGALLRDLTWERDHPV